MQTEELYLATCQLPGCDDDYDSMFLCVRHYAQRAKTTLTSQEFIAGFAAQQGACPYCLESLGTRFEIDHFHGDCAARASPGQADVPRVPAGHDPP